MYEAPMRHNRSSGRTKAWHKTHVVAVDHLSNRPPCTHVVAPGGNRGGFFGMNWMLLLVFGTIAVGTLMGTTAPPVL